jgi:hypothetical protein
MSGQKFGRKVKQLNMKKKQGNAASGVVLSVLLAALSLISARAQNLSILGTTSTTVSPYGGTGESIGLSVPDQINLDGVSGDVDFYVAVPAAYQINLNPASGTSFVIDVAYDGTGHSGLGFTGAMIVSFTGLKGTAPTFEDEASVGNGYLSLNLLARPTTAFSFTGIQFSLPVTGTGDNVIYPLSSTDTLNIQFSGTLSVTPVPEPSTLALSAIGGLGGLVFYVRRELLKLRWLPI